MINWIPLEDLQQLEEIKTKSSTKPCVIFKHSTHCSISSMAKLRLEDHWDFSKEEVDIYFLDLIRYRALSNEVAEQFSVYHESPQLILVRNGETTYDASHLDISVKELRECFESTF